MEPHDACLIMHAGKFIVAIGILNIRRIANRNLLLAQTPARVCAFA